ncbi:hypothetical protein MRB53_006604 [Persea americana]|uniref:Uncharacterized protein n=1 Tax=Persea americana TaxID=3435 RepID=A0ACC2MHJ8_PERAE|nr:hypothetical protein MRB53_006604 [Persea americana]
MGSSSFRCLVEKIIWEKAQVFQEIETQGTWRRHPREALGGLSSKETEQVLEVGNMSCMTYKPDGDQELLHFITDLEMEEGKGSSIKKSGDGAVKGCTLR